MFHFLRKVVIFCVWRTAIARRVLTSGSESVVAPDWTAPSETLKVFTQEIGRCYDPDGDWSSLPATPKDMAWATDFNAAVEASHGLGDAMPNAQVLSRPLTTAVKKIGLFANLLPWHTAAVLTNDRMKDVDEEQSWADSHCFKFDYTKDDIDDPHGCRFFRKSFQPLQGLRQCILGKLDQSADWKTYQKIAKRIISERQSGARHVENPLEVNDEEVSQFTHDAKVVKFTFDGIRRADEMIKYASLVDWEALNGEVIAVLESKISETIITRDRRTLLEEDLVVSIRKDCFGVEGDTWAELSQRAKTLTRAMPCYQLMWDQVEVSGGSEKPYSNAVGMFDPSLRYPSVVTSDLRSPPVCARAAVALIGDRTKNAPGGYSTKTCLSKGEKSWQKCLHPNAYNCICFTHCFRRALEKMCEFNAGCCPT